MLQVVALLLAHHTVPIDTGWQVATNNIWPMNVPTFAYQAERAPPWVKSVRVCYDMQGDLWLELENLTDAPLTCSGDISLRYRQAYDPFGYYPWWHLNTGQYWEIPASNPLMPGEERLIHVQWAGNIGCEDQAADEVPWWRKTQTRFGQFDAYYPALGRVNDLLVSPNNPATWESMVHAYVAGAWHDGTGADAPLGRLVGWVEYAP